ncbi:PREDICTED: mucin-17 [Dinoponera quadriceps]|uniref:Mucin-17 n=1 Tax=Dinoponera quadriceps TaxID=609295 RepID=A0A6P3WVJ8_DINQU|nr:PREDICTED: mucin-17 [Dinoponera quadriceps]XP_014470117.1 PREDICTED: mucin-17 [Dinoponera quadriceps]XP_014470118.1 PREDICTED: mucin-17 [Dinoponera quadriceps]
MAAGKGVCLLFVLLTLTCVCSRSWTPQNEGRKLFGGYTIVPKACRPTIRSRIKSSEPAICMFNYECTRRNGEVVGACMDGFLFGACCQLPPRSPVNGNGDLPGTEELLGLHQIDHVPDIPILLNPDGTPVGMSVPPNGEITKTDKPSVSNHLNDAETAYTKISTSTSHNAANNPEKTQTPVQPDISHLAEDFPVLLGQQEIIDDLRLPGLLTHSDSNNDIQDHQDPSAVNPVTTLLSPDQILQIADPVDQLPALFSQGIGHNHSDPETILLNENGTMLEESYNPDEIFRPATETSVDKKVTQAGGSTSSSTRVKFTERPAPPTNKSTFTSMQGSKTSTTPMMTKMPVVTQMYANAQRLTSDPPSTQLTMTSAYEKLSTIEKKVSTRIASEENTMMLEVTTPMSVTSVKDDELVKVPTITYDMPSSNKKKDDVLDKEEIAIKHIISILDNTTPKSDMSVTLQVPNSSPIQAWVSIDETSKPAHAKITSLSYRPTTPASPSTFPYTFHKPGSLHRPSSTYYNYELVPTSGTETTYASRPTSSSPYASRPSTQTTYGASSSHSKQPTTNPPAPTVIVLGPLGTGFTTETTQKPVTRKPSGGSTKPVSTKSTPVKPTVVSTKKPSVSTTITHNISTVISNVASNNVVSTSYISVNLKDVTSSAKPSVDLNTESVQPVMNTKARPSTRRPVIWTTISSWSDKPTFNLKPSTSGLNWSENLTPIDTIVLKGTTDGVDRDTTRFTTSTPCDDDETAAPDDLINFPPVRNPNLNISVPISQQEKPTIVETYNNTGYPDIGLISENDIPTPTFIEDDVLTNKVDAFVNKIVESLQGNFQNLKDVVYARNGTTTTSATPATVTKRPTVGASSTTRKPTRRATTRPSSVTTKKPSVTTKRPTRTTQRPSSAEKPTRPTKVTTSKPKPSTSQSTTTKRPQTTTKRPRPTKRPTTTVPPSSTETTISEEQNLNATESSSGETLATSDFRNQCGVRPLISRAGKIVGGKGAQFGEWPWQVLVREATWLGLFTKNKCGGVLITDKYVITAAHCQPGFLASLVAVFGEYDISGELETKRSVTKNVRRVIVNRGYDPATFENDLALLELESPVQFDEHIVPICMPEDGIDFTGRMATVTGWGRLKYNGGVPSVLQEVQVPIMENAVCQEMFQTASHSKLILDSFLCAGYANGQKDSCEGDSGGPLVMQQPDGRWFLVGTVSHGIKCAAPYLPGVYMRTTYFKPWLHSITGV